MPAKSETTDPEDCIKAGYDPVCDECAEKLRSQTTECPVCLGGAVTSVANDLGGFLVCRRCGGTGKIIISVKSGG